MVNTVYVNDKKIPLYKNDTYNSFIERIAVYFDTLPYFISKIDFKNLVDKDKINVSFLVKDITADDGISFKDFVEKNKIVEKYPEVKIDTLSKLWVSYNKPIHENDIYYFQAETELESVYGIKLDISRFVKDFKQEFLKNNQETYKKIVKKTKELTTIMKTVEELNPVSYINFKKEKSILSIKTNVKNISIDRIFADIVCTQVVPFAAYSETYKIFQDFTNTIPPSWSISLSSAILLKISNRLSMEDNIFLEQDYSDCVITFENGNLILNINVDYSLPISVEEIKNRIFQSFKNIENVQIIEENEESLAGLIFFPNQKFDKYIMSDIIIHNDIFSYFMAVDEANKASKKKSGLYIHFFLEGYDGTCSIISKKTEKIDQEVKSIDRKILPIGSDFIRLRINKAKNIKIAENFIEIFAKLLNIYNNEYKNILKIYKSYIPNFVEQDIVKEVQKSFSLKEIVPDLFLSNYSRRCLNPPKIIDDKDIEKYQQVMRFPKTEEEGSQYNYVCDEKPYIFVGLRVNNLENKDRYKYIPCCFKKDQMGKQSSAYKEYYLGQTEKKGDQQNILITNKIAPSDEFAILPKNIDELFFTIDDKYTYLRKGVSDTKQSFLECVLEGSSKEFATYSKKRKLLKLSSDYEKLVNYPNISVASQENPGESEASLRSILKNKDRYMDPRKWIRLCEVMYNCKIFLFSRALGQKDAVLETPNHKSIYLKYKSTSKTFIFIYEHYGNESDGATYPRCELIVKWDKSVGQKDGIEYNFIGKIPKEFEKLEKNLLQQFYYSSINRQLLDISDIVLPKINFVSQVIDSYGKTRALITKEKMVLLVSPIPPLNLPLYNENIYKPFSSSDIISFVNKYDLNIISQFVKNDILHEVNISYNAIIMTIKSNDSQLISDIPTETIEYYPNVNVDIDHVNMMKRLSSILVEYFIYMYSIFLSKNDLQISLESIKDFVKKSITISDTQYIIPTKPIVSIAFLKSLKFLNTSDKLIIENQEVLKRLVYCLRLRISINQQSVKSYHQQNEIYNFYSDIKYFTSDDNNIILKNLSVFEKIDNIIYDRILPMKEKFFLKNKYIEKNEPVLCIKADSLKDADNISGNWDIYGKIENKSIDDRKYDTKVYLYSSKNNVGVKKINRGGDEFFNVLAYKLDDDNVKYLGLAKL